MEMEKQSSMQEEDGEYENDPKERVIMHACHFLKEWKLVESLLHDIFSARRVSDLSSVHTIRSIMDKYQEEGQLIVPYLNSIVPSLMDIVRSTITDSGLASDETLQVIKPICIILYTLVTVCGYKSVTKFFPHTVSDLEPAVSLLDKCRNLSAATSSRRESTGEMETQCIVLLWLSILVLIPFDLSSVDSGLADGNCDGMDGPPPLVVKMLDICKEYLSNAGPMRTFAGLVLSKLLIRPDMSKAFTSFVDWTREVLSSKGNNVIDIRLLGAVEALAAIFKTGSTSILLSVVPDVWNDTSVLMNRVTDEKSLIARSSLLRKYLVKLTQRIGLTCLPRRSASWHYVGRKNTPGVNIFSRATTDTDQLNRSANTNSSNACQGTSYAEEEDMHVPDIMEDIIEVLLSRLTDEATIVRWSAAKGIGSVTSRLTYSHSDQVLTYVLELFSSGKGEGSWHGGCLALAELAHRGLLLPIQFPKVVPIVIQALHYDIRIGDHSVGSHVRDAAAYVCWAFGRAYSHRDMKDVLEQLTPHLLTWPAMTVRRAAAAAFQENVGRQGNYPHGIDIVNTADYFALASRANSYLHVAVSIAQYNGYLHQFVDDLLQPKICHLDKGLRELAARALSSLVKFEPEYFANVILEKLVPRTLSSDLCTQHGATLATGEVVLALYEHKYDLPRDKHKMVAGIVAAIEKAPLHSDKGTKKDAVIKMRELMSPAISRFIECISRAQIHLTAKKKRSLLRTLDQNLRHSDPQIQNAAVESLKFYIPAYLLSNRHKKVQHIMPRYLEQLTYPHVALRRGSALALGILPFEFVVKGWRSVLIKLCSACEIEDNPKNRDAEARANAAKGLVSVCETLTGTGESSTFFSGEDGISLFLFIKNEVMCSLFKSLEDYSTDHWGDVGFRVREAAMDGLERCTYILCKIDSRNQENSSDLELKRNDSSYFDASLATNLVGAIVKQAVEKMDKLRESAAIILRRILYSKTTLVPQIPHSKVLKNIVPDEAGPKWADPTFSFPRFVKLLELSCYSKYVVSGLVTSIGGLQGSLKKASLGALLGYLESTVDDGRDDSRVCSLSMDILWVLQKHRKRDIFMLPTLKTIEILFSQKLLLNMEAQTPLFCAGVLDSLAIELRGTRNFSKLNSGIAILGYIASISDPINMRAFSHLLTFLAHRYAKIRKCSAEQVYLVLQENGNLIPEGKLDEATEIITDTCWEGDVEEAKTRLQLCYATYLGTSQIVNDIHSESRKDVVKRTVFADEYASYSSLVGSSAGL